MTRASRSAPAYRHVDISCIPDEHRDEILGDADGGGAEFGLQVVEIVHNGPAQAPIYGVYAHNEDRWAAAKNDFGFSEERPDVDLTAVAEMQAGDVAARINAEEEEALLNVTGEASKKPKAQK